MNTCWNGLVRCVVALGLLPWAVACTESAPQPAEFGAAALACPAGAAEQDDPEQLIRWCAREDGVAHGTYIELSATGELAVQGTHHEGLPDGLWQGFTPAGSLRFEHWFDDGTPCGDWWDRASGGKRVERQFAPCGSDASSLVSAPKPGVDAPSCSVGTLQQGDPINPLFDVCVVGSVFDGPFVVWWDEARQNARSAGTYADGRLNGDFRSFWEEGGLRAEGRYDAGEQTGEWSYYDASGALLERGTWVDGRKDGEWRTWVPGGALVELIRWSGGVREGLHEQFHPDGTPAVDITWDAGIRSGPYRQWHQDGLGLKAEGTNVAGRLAGPWAEWASNGTQLARGQYADGVRTGTWARYDRRGQPISAGDFLEDVAVGEWTIWLDQGDLRIESRGPMLAGVAHGIWTGTWSTGAPYDSVRYEHGRREGDYEAFWPSGQRFVTGAFLADTPHFDWQYFYENGQLGAEGTYYRGERVGEWHYFDESGSPTDEEVF